MSLLEILYKIVESPHSLDNYVELIDYFNQNDMPQLKEAFVHLLEVKYGISNNYNVEQGQQSK